MEVQRKLRQNTGENCRNAELRVKKPRAKAGQNADRYGKQQRRPSGKPLQKQHDRDCAAGGKRAVDRQVGDIEKPGT